MEMGGGFIGSRTRQCNAHVPERFVVFAVHPLFEGPFIGTVAGWGLRVGGSGFRVQGVDSRI